MDPLDPFIWREQRHFAAWTLLSGIALFIILAWAPFGLAIAGLVVWVFAFMTLATYYDRENIAARAYLRRRAVSDERSGYASWNEVVGAALEDPELNSYIQAEELDS